MPFALFISLSVNDNVLPSMSSPSTSFSGSSGTSPFPQPTHSSLHPPTHLPHLHPLADSMYYSDYSSSGSPYKGSTSKATSKKGGIRGLLDSANSYIAPGIVKNV